MRTVTDLTELERDQPTIVTIGAFDGVHRGHQYLMHAVVGRARSLGYNSAVLTFEPRPQVVLRPGSRQLTGGAEKERLISAIAPDTLIVLPFTAETAQTPAGEFLSQVLDRVKVAEVWVGADFAFGHNREGNIGFLIGEGQKWGFGVHIVARQALSREPISSTRIRELIGAGDVRRASFLLGHSFGIQGQVVSGFGRGRELGFPTANIRPEPHQLLPATGIYAAHLRSEGRALPAAVSVGYNPVFGGSEIVVEAYVLDFVGDLRGAEVGLDFVARVRDEQRFESVAALVAAMHRDVAEVREILAVSEEPDELLLQP